MSNQRKAPCVHFSLLLQPSKLLTAEHKKSRKIISNTMSKTDKTAKTRTIYSLKEQKASLKPTSERFFCEFLSHGRLHNDLEYHLVQTSIKASSLCPGRNRGMDLAIRLTADPMIDFQIKVFAVSLKFRNFMPSISGVRSPE